MGKLRKWRSGQTRGQLNTALGDLAGALKAEVEKVKSEVTSKSWSESEKNAVVTMIARAARRRIHLIAGLREDLVHKPGQAAQSWLGVMKVKNAFDAIGAVMVPETTVAEGTLEDQIATSEHSQDAKLRIKAVLNAVMSELATLAQNIASLSVDALDAAKTRLNTQKQTATTGGPVSGANFEAAIDAAIAEFEAAKAIIASNSDKDHAGVAVGTLAATLQTAVHFGLLKRP
jgi:hypothetical protein